MPKHQLTMSPGYVEDWTYLEAVRELFQNALDNQIIDTDNEMYFEYVGDVLRIGNKTSVLEMDTLLLGSSSKRNNENTIGKHGEGYKVALMVLLREGKQVVFYNYGNRQVWNTRMIRSRKYNGAQIPEVAVDNYVWRKKPKHSLIIEVKGVTPEEYQKIVDSNLHLQGKQNGYETSNGLGFILTDEKYKGKIYVNGLFVCENKQFTYGYNMVPKSIRLDRDRKILDTIDLALVTSRMWRYANQEQLVAKMLMQDVWDVKYVKDMKDWRGVDKEKEIDDKITAVLKEEFVAEHGERAVPVSDNKELQRVSKAGGTLKPTMVSQTVSSYLQSDDSIASVPYTSPKQRFRDWFETIEHKLSDEDKDEFKAIMDDFED